jgi:hypothetical protein
VRIVEMQQIDGTGKRERLGDSSVYPLGAWWIAIVILHSQYGTSELKEGMLHRHLLESIEVILDKIHDSESSPTLGAQLV